MSRRISVAFANMIYPGWLAGGQYLYNLLFAIKSSEIDMELVLRIFPGTPKENYEMLNGLFDRVLEAPLPYWVERLPKTLKKNLPFARYFEERKLRQGGIDAQFLFTDLGYARSIPSVLWLPDFQHVHFPNFFTEDDLKYRTHSYPLAARESNLVILSSQHALTDLKHIAPDVIGKARVLNFVAQIPANVYQADSEAIARLYHLPDKFFFLPNQFWQHKNHEAVIKALALAKLESPELTVVCSGGVYDYRKPEYFDAILQQIAIHGLGENIRILGGIPREHFWQLMRRAVAVIQPSLFEGWSTSVEEVKSLGKSILLSDIPVHREQDPASAIYFDPQDPVELAQNLLKIQKEKTPGPELNLEQTAREQLRGRTRAFAQTFYEIINEIT